MRTGIRKALFVFLVALTVGVSPALAEPTGPKLAESPKSLSNGLYFANGFTAAWSGGSLTVILTGPINNDSFTRTSGTLQLQLWAVAAPIARGSAFVGYRLARSGNYSPMPPRTQYNNVNFTAAFSPPPDGTYWLVLSLVEFDSVQCAGLADQFCINEDSINSNSTSTFGVPTPTAVLENPAQGSYQSGIGLISGWSCASGTIVVRVDSTNNATAYGTPRGDTTSVCGFSNTGFGLLINYNLFGPGAHVAQLFVNGISVGLPVFFTVTVPNGEFMTGVSKQITVPNFPSVGRTTTLIWQESQQNFAIQSVVP
jgi:hypothetical protein